MKLTYNTQGLILFFGGFCVLMVSLVKLFLFYDVFFVFGPLSLFILPQNMQLQKKNTTGTVRQHKPQNPIQPILWQSWHIFSLEQVFVRLIFCPQTAKYYSSILCIFSAGLFRVLSFVHKPQSLISSSVLCAFVKQSNLCGSLKAEVLCLTFGSIILSFIGFYQCWYSN